MFLNLCWILFGISTGTAILNNKAAKDTIRRNGFEVDNSKTSAFEKINYFLTDYFYLVIPFYNIYKSVIKDRIKTRPAKYAANRMDTLSERGLLREIKKVEDTPSNQIEVKRNVVETPQRTESAQRVVNKEVERNKVVKAPEVKLTKEEELEKCKRDYKSLLGKYNEAEKNKSKPYETRKAMYDTLIIYKNHMDALKKQIKNENELREIKAQREKLVRTISDSKKLELK